MIQTNAQTHKFVLPENIQQIMLGVFDVDGVFRGKRMSRHKFLQSLDGGFGFCNVVLGWDIDDQLYDNTAYTGWHTGYPDAKVQIIEDSKALESEAVSGEAEAQKSYELFVKDPNEPTTFHSTPLRRFHVMPWLPHLM